MKKLAIVVLAVVAVAALALACWLFSVSHRRAVVAREYETRGYQMVEGCNGGAAVQADGQVLMLKQYLEDLTYPPVEDTNIVAQLQRALVVAQEKASVLSEDCRRRGHCESHPWTTNWAVIKQALAAVEKPK